MQNLYKLNLTWKKLPDKFWYCKIWDESQLWVEYNGEDFYNIIHYDRHGNEVDGIDGAYTVDGAKLKTEEWIVEQLENFMKKVPDNS